MSYDPSHRTPPRQERWPQATPAEAWPSYRDGQGEQADRQDAYAHQAADSRRRQAGPPSAVATAALPAVRNAYGTTGSYGTNGYGADGYGTNGYGADGYGSGARDDYGGTPDGGGNGNDGYGNDGYGSAGNGSGYRTGGYPSGGYGGGINGYARAADDLAGNGYGGPGGGHAEDGFDGAADGYTRTDLGYGQRADEQAAGFEWSGNGHAAAANGYAPGNGYAEAGYAGTENGYRQAADDYAGGYLGAAGGYGAYLGPGSYTETTYSDRQYAEAGYADPGFSDPGYSDPGYSSHGYSQTGYSGPGYSEAGYSEAGYFDSEFSGSGLSDSMLTAPDAGVHPDSWQADQALRRAAGNRGMMVSAATEFLATAVVIGVSTLAAGLLKSPVSPVGALGTAFIDRTPAVLRGFALHHFGAHGRTVLLLGMYAVIAVIAITIGAAARRAAALGVTGVAAFALVVAFVAITRPAGHMSDVMPAVIGGLAGVAALLWLVRASAPLQEVTPLRPVRGGTRRRTR